jgi:hypothetical protein
LQDNCRDRVPDGGLADLGGRLWIRVVDGGPDRMWVGTSGQCHVCSCG